MKQRLDAIDRWLSEFYKTYPMMPTRYSDKLADYAWIIILVFTVFGALSLYEMVWSLWRLTATGSYMAGVYLQVMSPFSITSLVISVAFTVTIIYLYARAVLPLRAKQAIGWRYLLGVLVLAGGYALVSAVFTLNVFGFIFSVLLSAVMLFVAGYALYQIRPSFIRVSRKKK